MSSDVVASNRMRVAGTGWGRVLVLMRLALLLGAVACGCLAYRDHFLVGQLTWWRWLVELLVAVTLVILAFWDRATVVERPVRKFLRWGCAGIAVGSVFLAVRLVPVHGSELAAAVAVFVALTAFALSRWVPTARVDVERIIAVGAVGAVRGMWAGVFVLLLGIGLVAGAVYANETNHLVALFLWLAGLATFACGAWLTTPGSAYTEVGVEVGESKDPAVGPELPRAMTGLLFLLILTLAASLRLFALGEVPTWIDSDEGRLAFYAQQIWQNGFPNVFAFGWNSFPHFTYILHYAGAQAFGESNTSLRLVSALIGTASLVPLFLWVRRWWGGYVALVAMFLLAVNQEHLYWSRVGFNNIDVTLVAGLILATLARALGTARLLDWVWVGFSFGLGFHTYHAAKLYPALILLALALVFATETRTWRTHGRGVFVAVVAMLLMIGPQFVSLERQWATFVIDTTNRNNLHQLFTAYAADDVVRVRSHIWNQVVGCLYAFMSLPYKQPLIDAATAVPFFLGTGWMLWRWREPRHVFVLMWVGGILVAGGMMTDYPPSKQRMVGMLPVVCLIAAVVAGRTRGLLHRALRGWAEVVVLLLSVGWLVLVLHGNWRTHFVYQAGLMQGDVMTNVCRRISAAERPVTVYTIGSKSVINPKQIERDCTLPAEDVRFAVNPVAEHAIVPLPPEHRGTAIISIPRERRTLVRLLREFYPRAKFETVRGATGDEDVYFLTITWPEVQQARGLIATYRAADGTLRVGDLPFAYPPPGTAYELVPPSDVPPGTEVSWRGSIRLETSGAYRFRVEGGTVRVGSEIHAAPERFIEGWHPIEVRVAADSRAGRSIEWQRLGSTEWERVPRENLFARVPQRGLIGRYFGEEHVTRSAAPIDSIEPLHERLESALAFDWAYYDDDAPPDWLAPRPSTMEWVGSVLLEAAAGHLLSLEATTPTQVFVAGELVAETEGFRDGPALVRAVPQVDGWVPILVRTTRAESDDVSLWRLTLAWSTVGGEWSVAAAYAPSMELRGAAESVMPGSADRSDRAGDLPGS